jgi:hypothetical protein
MPTTVTKKIGATNSPTAMDYSTIQGFEDALPANLVTADQAWVGECYDQGTFTQNPIVTFSGSTTDATHTITLRCAAGASFKGKAGVRTTALAYNSANGVTCEATGSSGQLIQVYDTPNVFIDGLQVKSTSFSWAIKVFSGGNPVTISNCIFAGGSAEFGYLADDPTTGTTVWANCLFQWPFAADPCHNSSGAIYNCTYVSSAGSPTTSEAIHNAANFAVVKNTAAFGFHDATTGTNAAGSDYNATDNSSFGGTGTHNKLSQTYSAQFVNSASDWRAAAQAAGTGLHSGTPDSTNSPTDISVFTRDATTPYIGAWEASAPSQSFTVTPGTIPKNHSGHVTLALAGTATTWAGGGSEFSLSGGVTGVSKVSENVTSATAATLVVDTGSGTGTETVTDQDSLTQTFAVATATLAVSPTSGTVSTTPTITLTGTNTVWAQETAAGLFSVSGVSGVSIGTPTVTTNTAATAVLTLGSSTGTATLTDNSTGATTTFSVNSVSGSIALTAPVAFQTYQRNGSNAATLTITGTYTGGPTAKNMEVSLAGSAYVTLSTVPSGGTINDTAAFTVTPATSNVQGTLTVRFRDATGINTTVANVGVGDVFLITGQSNANGLLTAQQSYSHATLKAAAYTDDQGTGAEWIEGNDPWVHGVTTGSIWPLLATLHMADQGVPAAFVQTAAGGTSLDAGSTNQFYWSKRNPSTGTAGAGYANAITREAAAGVGGNGYKVNLFYQGENDIDGSVDRQSYAAALAEFAKQVKADVPGGPKTVPVLLGYSTGSGTFLGVRLAYADVARIDADVLGPVCNYDIGPAGTAGGGNDLHITVVASGQILAERFWALLKAELFGGTAGTGRGPRVTGCYYNAARTVITVCFDQALKTGLTFATSVWGVTGNGSAATVNSVLYHPTDPNALNVTIGSAANLPILVSFATVASTAALVVPLGPDFAMPAGTFAPSTINLPAEPFKDVAAAAAAAGTGGGGSGYSRGRMVTSGA